MKKVNEVYESTRKFHEYEMKIIKMAGYVSDFYIDRALDTEDFSEISSFLIDYFSGSVGKSFDVGYLVSKYKEFGLDEKVEDLDFNVDEWYRIKYDVVRPEFTTDIPKDKKVNDTIDEMSDEEYLQYMIEKRKNDDE